LRAAETGGSAVARAGRLEASGGSDTRGVDMLDCRAAAFWPDKPRTPT